MTPPRCSLASEAAGHVQPAGTLATWRVWEVERSPRRAAQPLGHTGRPPWCARLPIGDSRALVPCIGTAPRLASPASAVALSSARRWLADAAPAVRDRLHWMHRPACRSRGRSPTVCATAVLLATGAAVRGSEAAASTDASQQARACGSCTSRRALHPRLRRPSRPPFPWLAVPVRAALTLYRIRFTPVTLKPF
jgi:hypothetical protein